MTAGKCNLNYPDGTQPHAVYRVFDESDRLIYVGCSINPDARIANHRITAWWSEQIARVEVEFHENRRDARDAERLAIREESPRWNVKSRWPVAQTEGIDSLRDYELAYSMTPHSHLSFGQAHLATVRNLIERRAVAA